jgi:hypothetical protein
MGTLTLSGTLAHPRLPSNGRAQTKSNALTLSSTHFQLHVLQVLQHVSCTTLGKTLGLCALASSLVKWVK